MAFEIDTIIMNKQTWNGFQNIKRVEACVNVVDTSYSRVWNVFGAHVTVNRQSDIYIPIVQTMKPDVLTTNC